MFISEEWLANGKDEKPSIPNVCNRCESNGATFLDDKLFFSFQQIVFPLYSAEKKSSNLMNNISRIRSVDSDEMMKNSCFAAENLCHCFVALFFVSSLSYGFIQVTIETKRCQEDFQPKFFHSYCIRINGFFLYCKKNIRKYFRQEKYTKLKLFKC